MKKQNGNVMIIATMMMTIMIVILLLIVAVLIGNINGIIHGVKTDMYLMNKSAIVAVNKNLGSIDVFSYNEKEYYQHFKELLQKNYHLNENLESSEGLIEKVTIEEYKIYRKNQKDSITKKRVDDTVVHTVITVKIRPIILQSLLEKQFVFRMHEDIYMKRALIGN